jgi:hypothetical protein
MTIYRASCQRIPEHADVERHLRRDGFVEANMPRARKGQLTRLIWKLSSVLASVSCRLFASHSA